MDRYVYEWKDMYMNKKICKWLTKYVYGWTDMCMNGRYVYG